MRNENWQQTINFTRMRHWPFALESASASQQYDGCHWSDNDYEQSDRSSDERRVAPVLIVRRLTRGATAQWTVASLCHQHNSQHCSSEWPIEYRPSVVVSGESRQAAMMDRGTSTDTHPDSWSAHCSLPLLDPLLYSAHMEKNQSMASRRTPTFDLHKGSVFTALHVMQTRYCDENSVCPSVCPSVSLSVCLSHACFVTKQ